MLVACVVVLPLGSSLYVCLGISFGYGLWIYADRFTGSMADVPKDLLQEIERLERLFTIPKEKLKEITSHFVKELEKGIYHQSHL